MTLHQSIKTILSTSACALALALATTAQARSFDIPAGDLKAALNAYSAQSGVSLIFSGETMKGVRANRVQGDLPTDDALSRLLKGTGFSTQRDSSGAIGIIPSSSASDPQPLQIAQAVPVPRSVETVTVTSSKLGGADVQSIPITITALSQEQLTSQQIAGGPDLIKSVPNLTFTKTNFSGYSIQIRGIGTQAISTTTDPAVAVAMNDIPFIRNHFFEQEFFDLAQVEVVRGPQGTLYGRNATAGVVNLTTAKPSDHYEAMASVDVGNYNNRRLEGMLNIPIVGDRLGLRVAGEWTKRDGYSFNETTDKAIDGRNLWSGRVTLGLKPVERLQIYGMWEHFSEDDDRVRSAKQLCKKDPGPTSVDGYQLSSGSNALFNAFAQTWLSQGCLPTSLYSDEAFQTPNGSVIPFVAAYQFIFNGGGSGPGGYFIPPVDPYANKTQPKNLRVIQSDLSPTYRVKADTFMLNADFAVTPELTLTSQTGYNKDYLYSTQDFNRFNTVEGMFDYANRNVAPWAMPPLAPNGVYCDPQLGCSRKMVAMDLVSQNAWQFSQELRLASHFEGPFNFSIGANYLRYQTVENYYVFMNVLTAATQVGNNSGAGDYGNCYATAGVPLGGGATGFGQGQKYPLEPIPAYGYPGYFFANAGSGILANFGCQFNPGDFGYYPGTYIDPNPISSLDGNGHNYFRSQNPYKLNSYAGFGEAYYQVAPDLKLTAGLRWTDDNKRFWNYPSWAYLQGGGYPLAGIVEQEWKEWTGRFNATWTPKLDFTDQTMIYASYARGYKGGGANPPGPQKQSLSARSYMTHPETFKPEFVNAFEFGTKNTLLDGSLTLNADVFYYDYKNYQISQIVDRTSINLNFDAKVKGAEAEMTWEPLPGLQFNVAGGLQDSSVNKGQSAIDIMDRTAGHDGWMVVKPSVASTSNCILPTFVVKQLVQPMFPVVTPFSGLMPACDIAYGDPGNGSLYGAFAAPNLSGSGVVGFDPSLTPNNGEGFAKDLGGNSLPNTPPFTLSAGAQYSMLVSESWSATFRGDFYWQGNSFARIFNDRPYDQIHGYSTANLAIILTNQDGWQAMGYVKNVFDKTAITGAFLNSDDTALTTNVFLTDPRLFGIRITKNW